MAWTASTIVSELISRTKELAEVKGMSNKSDAFGPTSMASSSGLLRSNKYTEIRAPNSRHSEPRNAHMVSFSLVRPVEVGR